MNDKITLSTGREATTYFEGDSTWMVPSDGGFFSPDDWLAIAARRIDIIKEASKVQP